MEAAALSLKVDSNDLVKAANDLDKFSASAAKAGGASNIQTSGIAKLVSSVQSANSKLTAAVATLDKIGAGMSGIASAAQKATSSQNSVADASRKAAAAQSSVATEASQAAKQIGNADAQVVAYRQHLQALVTQLQAAKAAGAGAAAGPARGPSSASAGATSTSAADLQRYIAAAKAVPAANQAASTSTLTLQTSQSKLSISIRAATADIRAQIEALRDLNGSSASGAGAGGAAGGAASRLALAFGTLEAAAKAAAAVLREIRAPAGGSPDTPPPAPPRPGPAGGGAPRGSSSPYYGAASLEATGQAAQLASHHAQNLFYQLNDVFVSLASGQKPMTVFIQQGSQIGQIYAQTGLTLKGFALGLASMLRLMTTTTAATEAAAFASAQQATASIAAANAQATSAVRAAETNIAIAQTQIAMATTATEAAAAEARLAVALAALSPAQAEAAITGQALATAQEQQAAAAAAARSATTTSLTGLGIGVAAAAVVLAAATAGIAALTAQANDDSGLKKYTTAMGYTKAEVKKLNGVTVSFGDTMKAVWQVSLQSVASALGINTSNMAKTWERFLDRLISGTRATLAGIYALFAGTKAYLGEIEKGGLVGLGKMAIGQGDPKLLEKTYGQAYKDSQKFMDRIVSQARTNARKRQDEMAKGFYDAPKAKKGPKEYGFSDLLKDADKTRNDLTKQAAQIGLYGEALARVTYEQDLLNKASEHGLKLSPQQKAAIAGIAAELAKLAEANRHANFMESFSQQTEQQLRSLEQARGAIGLTGRALVEYTYYQEQLNKALADHINLTDADKAKILSDAQRVGDATYANTVAASADATSKAHNERMRQLNAEQAAIALTGQALISYQYQQEMINKAVQDGVALADIDTKNIKLKGDAYAYLRMQVDQQQKAMQDAREVVGGFFNDFIAGARQSTNVITSFGNAVENALNRVIDKLLDKTLDTFLNGMFQGGTGGFLSGLFGQKATAPGLVPGKATIDLSGLTGERPDWAKGSKWDIFNWATGGMFGSAQKFAKGGSFTNQIVSNPTLFRFAKGAKMGEMGEAGPEAIMPLKRGPNGSLGVQMHGGGRPAVRMGDVYLEVKLEGAISEDRVVGIAQQAAQGAVVTIRRDMANIQAEYQNDGGIVE